jgi:hypothetical protein
VAEAIRFWVGEPARASAIIPVLCKGPLSRWSGLAVADANGAELLNSNFDNLKSHLLGMWSFVGKRSVLLLKQSLTVKLFWNAIRGLSPFINYSAELNILVLALESRRPSWRI